MQASGGYQIMWLQVDLDMSQPPMLCLCMQHKVKLNVTLDLLWLMLLSYKASKHDHYAAQHLPSIVWRQHAVIILHMTVHAAGLQLHEAGRLVHSQLCWAVFRWLHD